MKETNENIGVHGSKVQRFKVTSSSPVNRQNRNKKRTSNIQHRTSNVELGYALGVKRPPHSTFDVERSMFNVHLF